MTETPEKKALSPRDIPNVPTKSMESLTIVPIEPFPMMQKRPHTDSLKGPKAFPKGELDQLKYDDYYDNNNTITIAQTTDPHDQDNPNYNVEPIYQSLQRRAEKVWGVNDAAVDGGATIVVIVSHVDVNQFTRERPIYPQQFKVYYNVFEIRIRSASKDTPYRVTEYELGSV